MKKLCVFLALFILLTLSSCSETSQDSGAGEYTQTEITINPGEWELPGTLTLPGGDGPFPVVIFVHGSGPADRDETIGKQKLFADLAVDLADIGIASLRYDKRTYIYSSKIAEEYDLTVKEETIDDVMSAVEYAMGAEKLDVGRIIVAGHSMGGYLLPRIDAQDSENRIAGYISLAGSVRSMMELTIEQLEYILPLEKGMSDSDRQIYMDQYIALDEAIKALDESDRGGSTILGGAYPTYWLDLADYDPAKEIKNVSEPLLFLQGEHDYQVTMTDFELWKAALADSDNSEFVSFPNLTHTFTETESMSVPNDYTTYKKVDKAVAETMRDFILKLK